MKKLIAIAAALAVAIPLVCFAEDPIIEEYDIKEEVKIKEVSKKPQDGVEYHVQKSMMSEETYFDSEGPVTSEDIKPVGKASTPKAKSTAKSAADILSDDPVIIEKADKATKPSKAKKDVLTVEDITPVKGKKSIAVKPPKAEKKRSAPVETIDEPMEINSSGAGTVKEVKVSIKKDIKIAPSYDELERDGSFRFSLVGPGIYAGNKGINAMMGIGLEGEYFFLEKLSAGLNASVATNFKSNNDPNTILSFIPQVRYFFDFTNHPRWTVFLQGGAGVGLFEGKHACADIAIPGGGFEWQYNSHFSVGMQATMHFLVRSETAVSFFAGPVFRYQF